MTEVQGTSSSSGVWVRNSPVAAPSKASGLFLTSSENRLIQVQGAFSAALAIASVFLSLYLFKVGGFADIALFYAAQYFVMPPSFIAAGYIMRRRSTQYVIRLGLVILCSLFVVLLAIGDRASQIPILLGAIMGIGEGLYWPGINLSEYLATDTKTRNLYYGKLFMVSNLASVIGLPLSGLIITVADSISTPQSGYYVLFGFLIGVLILTHYLGRGIAPNSQLTFSISHIRRHTRSRAWKLVLAQNLCRGIWAYAIPAFSAVLLYLIVKGELALSVVAAVATIITGIASFSAGKILQRHPRTFLLGALIVPVGMIGFAFWQNWAGIFCYVVLLLGFDCFAQNFTYKAMYDVMEWESSKWEDTYHFIVEREIAWNFGRVISFVGALFVLQATDQADALAKAIAVVAFLPLVVGVIQYQIHRSGRHSPTLLT